MRIEITCEQLQRAEKLLHGIPNAVPKATANAMNRGLDTLRAESSRQIRKRYAISSGSVKKYQRVTLKRAAGAGDNTASIEFAGKKIPLYQFRPSAKTRTYTPQKIPVRIFGTGGNAGEAVWRLVNKNAGISAMDIKESGMQARPKAFIATFRSGHTGLFKRTGKQTGTGNGEIKEYWGPGVADMLDYEPAKQEIAEKVQETVNKRMEHEIGRILSRY